MAAYEADPSKEKKKPAAAPARYKTAEQSVNDSTLFSGRTRRLRPRIWRAVELLLENQRRSADSLPFQADIHFDTVCDFDEGNALVHPVVLAVEGHCAVDASRGRSLPLSVSVSFSAFVTPRIVKSPSRSNVFGPV